jgi:hypothetical protein
MAAGACQAQFAQRVKDYCWIGLLLFNSALSLVYTFAVTPAMFSFECIANQRVGLCLADGITPPFQGQLLELLQGRGAMSSLEAGGEEETGRTEGTDESVQKRALAGGSRAAVVKVEAAGEGRMEAVVAAGKPSGGGVQGAQCNQGRVEQGQMLGLGRERGARDYHPTKQCKQQQNQEQKHHKESFQPLQHSKSTHACKPMSRQLGTLPCWQLTRMQ